jgi:hypothetical protein
MTAMENRPPSLLLRLVVPRSFLRFALTFIVAGASGVAVASALSNEGAWSGAIIGGLGAAIVTPLMWINGGKQNSQMAYGPRTRMTDVRSEAEVGRMGRRMAYHLVFACLIVCLFALAWILSGSFQSKTMIRATRISLLVLSVIVVSVMSTRYWRPLLIGRSDAGRRPGGRGRMKGS